MATYTRNKTDVYLLGSIKEALCGTKLPSIQGYYLHKMKTSKTNHEPAVCTMNEVNLFWEKARIPMRRINHAIKKLEELVKKWEGLKKNKARRIAIQVANEEDFKETFNDLFD